MFSRTTLAFRMPLSQRGPTRSAVPATKCAFPRFPSLSIKSLPCDKPTPQALTRDNDKQYTRARAPTFEFLSHCSDVPNDIHC